MGLYNAQSVVAAQKSFSALFRATADSITPMWRKVAMEATSVNAEENYQWLGSVPAMREWLDTKVLEQLRGFDYLLKNKDWEATLEVDRNSFEDDLLGMYEPRIRELADEGMRHPDELLASARVVGFTSAGLCYDGQQFYDTDHTEGNSGTQSNVVTGTGITVAALAADFRSARARMRTFKNDRGKPYVRKAGALNLCVTCSPDLEGVFEEFLNAAIISNTTNVLRGAAELVVDPYLSGSDWYLDYVGGFVKPFIFQNRKRPDFVSLDNAQASEMVFLRKKLAYSVEARYNLGYGLWQYSVMVNN